MPENATEDTRTTGRVRPPLPALPSAELRALLDSDTALGQCLRALDEGGARLSRCPHCQGERLYRHGVTHGLQRYRCRCCGRTCNALTNTPLARLRLRGKWLAFLECALRSMTVRGSAATIGIHRNTSFRWRHRFEAAPSDGERPELVARCTVPDPQDAVQGRR